MPIDSVVWALLLNRTLVLPHLLGHGTAKLRAAHSDAFDVEAARSTVKPLRVEEMETWLRLGLVLQRLLVLSMRCRSRGDHTNP